MHTHFPDPIVIESAAAAMETSTQDVLYVAAVYSIRSRARSLYITWLGWGVGGGKGEQGPVYKRIRETGATWNCVIHVLYMPNRRLDRRRRSCRCSMCSRFWVSRFWVF